MIISPKQEDIMLTPIKSTVKTAAINRDIAKKLSPEKKHVLAHTPFPDSSAPLLEQQEKIELILKNIKTALSDSLSPEELARFDVLESYLLKRADVPRLGGLLLLLENYVSSLLS